MCWASFMAGAYSMGAITTFVIGAFFYLLWGDDQSMRSIVVKSIVVGLTWPLSVPCKLLGIV